MRSGNDQKKHSLASYAKDSASFLLKISTSGVIQWLRGPLALDLQYVKAVEIDAHDDSVYAAGFYEGAVYFPPTFASLADASIVQGWLAKFSANGTLSCKERKAKKAGSIVFFFFCCTFSRPVWSHHLPLRFKG